MGYENARSTQLLATHCICCGRPLRDPISVETGVGPICRQRHGYTSQGDEDTRAACSKLIHAAAQKGLSAVKVYAFADKIQALGFTGVADRVRTRFVRAYEWETGENARPIMVKRAPFTIRGKKHENAIWLHTPYSKKGTKEFNAELKQSITGEFRTGTKDNQGTFWWIISPEKDQNVNGLLKAHFEGRMCHGSKGNFIIGEVAPKEELSKEVVTNLIDKLRNDMAGTTIIVARSQEEIATAAKAKVAAMFPAPAPVEPVLLDLGECWGDLD